MLLRLGPDRWHLRRWELQDIARSPAQVQQQAQAVLAPLRDIVLAPWSDALAQATQVIIAPWGILHQLPWAMLCDGMVGQLGLA